MPHIFSAKKLEWPGCLKSELWKNSLRCTRFVQGCDGSKQPAILQKTELILDPSEQCKFWYSCKKTSLVKTSPQSSCWSGVYSCNFIKSRLDHRGFSTWFCKVALLKTLLIFLQDILVIHSLRKLQASNQ